jgi:hypothetical protein
MPMNKLLKLYVFKVIVVYEKCLVVTYRYLATNHGDFKLAGKVIYYGAYYGDFNQKLLYSTLPKTIAHRAGDWLQFDSMCITPLACRTKIT